MFNVSSLIRRGLINEDVTTSRSDQRHFKSAHVAELIFNFILGNTACVLILRRSGQYSRRSLEAAEEYLKCLAFCFRHSFFRNLALILLINRMDFPIMQMVSMFTSFGEKKLSYLRIAPAETKIKRRKTAPKRCVSSLSYLSPLQNL